MIIYDSTNPYDIPTSAEAVAPYVDGLYGPEHKALGSATGWDEAAISRFPNAVKIGIAVFASTNDGRALDVERYDATPAQAPGWVHMRIAAGAKLPLLIYCNRSNGAAVESALDGGGFHPGDGKVALWPATLLGSKTVVWNNGAAPRYPVAMIQYANSALSGGHYDLSITTAYGDSSAVITGVEMLDPNDPIVQRIQHQMDVIGWIWKALGIQDLTGQSDISGAQSSVLNGLRTELDAAKAELDALKAQVAALPAPTVTIPTQISLTGTLHS